LHRADIMEQRKDFLDIEKSYDRLRRPLPDRTHAKPEVTTGNKFNLRSIASPAITVITRSRS
jgi:hypothetical protein